MRGTGLILLVFLGTASFHYSRWALPEGEALPAVMRLKPQLASVIVVDNRGNYGLYQFYDGSKLCDVIKLTEAVPKEITLLESLCNQPAFSGEMIKVIDSEGKYIKFEHSWLSARHRILLQIPLHPDRMTLMDWEALPGIGPKLAANIEFDRQKNGDFNEFSALKRVKGIGEKKLDAWQEFFVEKIDRDRK